MDKNIEIRGNSLRKATITFELFFGGHSTDSTIHDLLEFQIQSFIIFYYSSPAPHL